MTLLLIPKSQFSLDEVWDDFIDLFTHPWYRCLQFTLIPVTETTDSEKQKVEEDQEKPEIQSPTIQPKIILPTRKVPASVPARQRALLMRIQKKEQLKQSQAQEEQASEDSSDKDKTNICKYYCGHHFLKSPFFVILT